MEGYHGSVLLKETIDALHIEKGKWYLDCTLGDGGHSLEILKRGGKVIGVDVDPEAIKRAEKRLRESGYFGNFKLLQGNFRDIEKLISILARPGLQGGALRDEQTETVSKFAGVMFDLGVSSLQLEDPARGFSFSKKGPLDMRMDPTLQVFALDLISILSRKELYELFHTLGEEKYSKRLADTLVRTREVNKGTGYRVQGTGIKSTKDLADLVENVYRKAGIRDSKIHPATRIFQALRIAVNDELGAIKEGLTKVKDVIEKNGYVVVISFHSLEDRIVKSTFKQWELNGIGEVVTKKPIIPTDLEIMNNLRSRSAKLRVFRIL